MSHEVMLQFDIFSGELVDNRTTAQKQRDTAVTKPRQLEMFSQRELAQYVPPPMMSLSPETKLVLMVEDPRTEEEKARDREVAARALTTPLFADQPELAEPATTITVGETPVSESEDDEPDTSPAREPATPESRAAALAELERVVTDISQTIAAAPDVLRAQSMWLALATVEAQSAGVPKDEVVAILHRLDGASTPRTYSELLVRHIEHHAPQAVVVFEADHLREHLPMTIF